MNGWNLQIHPIRKGTSSEPKLHDFVFQPLIFCLTFSAQIQRLKHISKADIDAITCSGGLWTFAGVNKCYVCESDLSKQTSMYKITYKHNIKIWNISKIHIKYTPAVYIYKYVYASRLLDAFLQWGLWFGCLHRQCYFPKKGFLPQTSMSCAGRQ